VQPQSKSQMPIRCAPDVKRLWVLKHSRIPVSGTDGRPTNSSMTQAAAAP
jgi:UDP-N-acetylmuramate-alanine ligase